MGTMVVGATIYYYYRTKSKADPKKSPTTHPKKKCDELHKSKLFELPSLDIYDDSDSRYIKIDPEISVKKILEEISLPMSEPEFLNRPETKKTKHNQKKKINTSNTETDNPILLMARNHAE